MRLRYGLWFLLISLLVLPQTLYGQSITIPISNSHWFFSPYNWNVPGKIKFSAFSAMASPSTVDETVTNQPGAYFTLSFANSTQAVLNLDTLGIPAGGNATTLVVQWRIDGTLYPAHSLSLTDTQMTLATGLTTTAHTLQFWLVSSDYHQDRWTKATPLLNGYLAPAQSLRVSGLTLDAGATVSTSSALRPKRILFYGDSITDGDKMTPLDDAGQAFTVTCAQLLNAEYGVVGTPGQGWACNIAPTTGLGFFGDSFAQYYAQTPRFSLINTFPDPDYVFINIGTNDSIFGSLPGTVTVNVLACMQRLRNYLPSSQIVLVVPFGGFQAQALQLAYAQYTLAQPSDKKVTFLNLGPTAQIGLTAQTPLGTAQSFDGIHPNPATHRALGCQLAAALQTALGRNDFNGDGKSDLVLQNIASNQIGTWFQNDTLVLNSALYPNIPNSDYPLVTSGDFNGDGKPDYIFQSLTTNQIAYWYMDGPNIIGNPMVARVPASGCKIVGAGDFNGDGKLDLVFQDQNTNKVVVWYMDGAMPIGNGSAISQIPAAGYKVVGVGDFNRDGQPDLLFQNVTTGALVVWYLNGVQVVGGEVVSVMPSPGYHVEAVADFDGDGRPDVVMRDGNGNVQIWHLDNAYVYLIESLSARLDPAFRIAGPR